MQERQGYRYGAYERLDPGLLPPIYIAYKEDISGPTEVFHNDIRARYQRGEAQVVAAMQKFAALAAEARVALLAGDHDRLAALMNENFDTRRSIYRLPAAQIEMVDRARQVGVSAKFAGSGGAIVGTYRDETMLAALRQELGKIGCVVILPQL
jgi:glucuronokinase